METQEHTQRCVWSRVLGVTEGRADLILPGARMGTQWYSGGANMMVLYPVERVALSSMKVTWPLSLLSWRVSRAQARSGSCSMVCVMLRTFT